MKYRFFILLLVLVAGSAKAADSLRVVLPKTVFQKGDSLDFTCTLPFFASSNLSSATLNVWIEDLSKTKRWKFRYPIINGVVDAGLAIGNSIPEGSYAVSFVVQRGFFKIYGEVKEHAKKDSSIYYMMVQKNDQQNAYLDLAKVAPDGSFRLKSTLFADSAFFIFTPAKKAKTNSLSIHIETPLDSAFTPVYQETRFITVGQNTQVAAILRDTSRFVFDLKEPSVSDILPNVTVTTRAKKKVELYDAEYSFGLFRSNDALVFDGLETDEIANSPSVLLYLLSRVPGLSIGKDADGLDVAKWRKETVELYIDEFRVSSSDYELVPPAEIAMIKVYRPPARLGAGAGNSGAIALYTKKGNYINPSGKRHNFVVKGYTPIDAAWQ